MKVKLAIAVAAAILILVFLLQNTQVVTLRLYFWKVSMSQIILIPLTAIIGFVLGFIAAKLTGKSRKLRKGNNFST